MKISVSLFLIVVHFALIAQENVTTYKLDHLVTSKSYISEYHPEMYRINYYRQGEDIIRVEDAIIQCYDKNMTKKWEHTLAPRKVVNDSCMYIFHVGENGFYAALHRNKAVNGKKMLDLTRISREGHVQKINVPDFYPVKSVDGLYERNDTLFLFGFAPANDSLFPCEKDSRYTTSVYAFDSKLDPLGQLYTINLCTEGVEALSMWEYMGMLGENYLFITDYFVDSTGKVTFDSGHIYDDYIVRTVNKLLISPDFKVVSQQKKEILGYYDRYYRPDLYDTEKYKVTSDLSMSPDRELRSNFFDTLEVSCGGKTTGNIVAKFNQMVGLGTMSIYGILLENIIEDPVNESFVVIASCPAKERTIIIQFDTDLNISTIQTCKGKALTNFGNEGPHFATQPKKASTIWGTPAPNHKTNAFDLIHQKANGSQFTVVNFDDYQLLFEDNIDARLTWVYKIVK